MADRRGGGDGDADAAPGEPTDATPGEPGDTPSFDVAAVGTAAVDRIYEVTNIPEPDGGAYVRDRHRAMGGVAANVASGLARLGAATGLVARVGGDDDGDRVLADLDERGIDARRVRRGDERSTYSMVFRDPDGQRTVVNGGDSATNLRLDDADLAYCRRADAVFTSAYAPDPVTRRLLAARRDGDLPSLWFALTGPIEELEGRATARETLDDLLGTVDCFLTSRVPARSYLDCGPVEAARRLRERGVERGAVTRGADGAVLFDGDGRYEIDAVDVDVTDATGAGDAFAAGLLRAWALEDRPPREAGRFAAAVAALNCTAEGARGGLPTVEAVERFLAERGGD